MTSGLRYTIAVICMLMLIGTANAADKTDVVFLKNGDRLTGEIKLLERGLLTFKTDDLGTLSIEWKAIDRIQTRQLLEVEQINGERRHGHAVEVGAPGTLALDKTDDGRDDADSVALDSIVHMVPLSEGNWLDRLDGHVSAGVSASSANDDRKYTIAADASYRDVARSWDAAYDAARTESSNNDPSERDNLTGTYRWLRDDRWFWAATAGLTRNDELDLNLRSLAGAGVGRYWIRDQNHELSAVVGIAASREDYSQGAESRHSFEAVLQGNYSLFHFDPDIDVSVGLTLYPSLTISGRLRSEADVSARIELIKDLYYELSYVRSQDNKPPNVDSEEVDWSVTSSLGYKF